jgi:flagellar biosynthetic protein FliR
VSQSTANQLIAGIGGAHVASFFIVLARVSPLFFIAPLFSSRMIPRRVRAIVAVALAFGLTPVASHGVQVPDQPLAIAGLIVQSMLVGLAFAFVVAAVFAALSHAGAIIDGIAGFSFGSTIDPINGNQDGVLTHLYNTVGVMIFITIGGDAWMLRGIARTFTLVPIDKGPQIPSLVGAASSAFGQMFVGAVELAAPAMLALLITDVAFGMVSRVVPQLNVFAVGFPMKVGVALLVVAGTLGFFGNWLSDQLMNSVGSALQAMKVA